MELRWDPTCLEMDNLWWSPEFWSDRTYIGFLNECKATMSEEIIFEVNII
jgi:hypothetical protein